MNRDTREPISRRLSQEEELDRDLNRIFDGSHDGDAIVPSAGFSTRVMESIREDAHTPPPLPFPWKRALPAFGCALAVLVYAVLHFSRQLSRVPEVEGRAMTLHLPAVLTTLAGPLGWTALALLVALISVRLCLRSGSPTT